MDEHKLICPVIKSWMAMVRGTDTAISYGNIVAGVAPVLMASFVSRWLCCAKMLLLLTSSEKVSLLCRVLRFVFHQVGP